MGKLIHFSDPHVYSGNSDDNSILENIVEFSNVSKSDHLVFTGDLLDGHSFAKTLSDEEKAAQQNLSVLGDAKRQEDPVAYMKEKHNAEITLENIDKAIEESIPVYKNLIKRFYEVAQNAYTDFEGILKKSEANVESVVGNHDVQGMEEVVESANFKPNETFGKYFFQTGGPGGIPGNILYDHSPEEYAKHAIENNPKIMLWHQGPHSNKYFQAPDWTQSIDSKIHLYGHNHPEKGYHVKFDKENDVFEMNVCTQKGYFGEVEYDDNGSMKKWKIYQIGNQESGEIKKAA